jgi:general secretion pathway protein E
MIATSVSRPFPVGSTMAAFLELVLMTQNVNGARLGERLVSVGKLGERDLERALLAQQEMGGQLGEVMVKLGLVAELDVVMALSQQLSVSYVSASDLPVAPALPEGVSKAFLQTHLVYPLKKDDAGWHCVLAHPEDAYVCSALVMAVGQPVVAYIGEPSVLERAVPVMLNPELVQAEDIDDSSQPDGDEFIEHLKDLASEAPVIRLVSQIISDGLGMGASDIHIEPFEGELHLRYRVDGVIQRVEDPPFSLAAAVVSRIKLLAGLNIAERRLPQDGRIKTRIKGREIDLRVSTVPISYGESVVLRILDRASVRFGLGDMGFAPNHLAQFERLVQLPHGIVLITGPTGSGKTTTLYAALSTLDAATTKIITVEDPVEYQLEQINQIQVHPSIGLTFAHALRSILRQDPDVIMIGEMRDAETAEIAVQSSLTGHLVLSTLHTNTAAGAITRLEDMGVPRYLITSSVTGILAQRLVRKLCGDCKKPHTPSEKVLRELGQPQNAGGEVFYEPVGCPSCKGTGYRGRTAIHELMVLGSDVQAAILRGSDANTLHRLACQHGMVSLREDGLRAVSDGLTSVEEVLRVTQDAIDA